MIQFVKILIIFLFLLSGRAWAADQIQPFYDKVPSESIEKSAYQLVLQKDIASLVNFDGEVVNKDDVVFGNDDYIEWRFLKNHSTIVFRTIADQFKTNLIVVVKKKNGRMEKIHFDVFCIKKTEQAFQPTRVLDVGSLAHGDMEGSSQGEIIGEDKAIPVVVVPTKNLGGGAPKEVKAVNEKIAAQNGISLIIQSIEYYDNGVVLNVVIDNKSPANLTMNNRTIAVYDEEQKRLLTSKAVTDTSILYTGKQRVVNILIEGNKPSSVILSMPYDKKTSITGKISL